MEGCLRLLLLLMPALAWADSVNNEWNSTTRSQSMGNIGIASSEDPTTAMFYNPAALSRSKKTQFEFFSPQFEVGTGAFVLGKGAKDLPKSLGLSKVRPLLEAKPNTGSYLGFSIYPNLNAQNFNFGILLRGEGLSYHDGSSLFYRSRYLLIPSLGLSLGAISGRIRLGIAVRGIQITENDREVAGTISSNGVNDPAVGYRLNASEGFGVGLDSGVLISMPMPSLPTIGFVARNIGDTSFSGSAPFSVATGTAEAKQKIKMTYDAGFSIFPKLSQRSSMVLGVDYRDILDVYGVDAKRKINLGLEFGFYKMLFLRAGISRGYWTAGMGIASKNGSLDLGSYAEEMDAKKFRLREDRRISLRYGRSF